ncbi:MAG: HRDC domain-containing protein, partial [Flavobacteriales bacterium]
AQDVLAGKGRVQLAEIPSRQTERNRPVPEILVAHQRDADSGELFEALRKLRLEIAREEKVAPYIVFHDRSLREMCDRLPLSESELRSISGLSDRKMEKYGERFLSLLREWESFSQS